MDIRFDGQKDAQDFGAILSFQGMATFEGRLKKHITGIEYNKTNSNDKGGRGSICYKWTTGETTCPIVTSSAAIFGCSPFNDVIRVRDTDQMIIMNEKGRNRYEFELHDAITQVHIIDKSKQSATLRFNAPYLIKIIFVEREEAFEVYKKESSRYEFKLKVIFKGSKNKPTIEIPDRTYSYNSRIEQKFGPDVKYYKTISFKDIEKGRDGLSSIASVETIINSFNFKSNAEVKSNRPRTICACPPKKDEQNKDANQGYFKIKAGANVDTLIISQFFIDYLLKEELTANLVYEKRQRSGSSGWTNGWSLQIRHKNDMYQPQYPRYDVSLDGIEVIKTDTNKVLFDLSDPSPLEHSIDLIDCYNKQPALFSLIRKIDNSEDSSNDDYVIIRADLESPQLQFINLNLSSGLNSIVCDISELPNKKINFKMSKDQSDLKESALANSLQISIGDRQSNVSNVDRLVCQFRGGLQRDILSESKRAGFWSDEPKNLYDECMKLDVKALRESSDRVRDCIDECRASD